MSSELWRQCDFRTDDDGPSLGEKQEQQRHSQTSLTYIMMSKILTRICHSDDVVDVKRVSPMVNQHYPEDGIQKYN